MNASALRLPAATSSLFSRPVSWNLACAYTNRPKSPYVKYLRAARPRAKCTSDEPCTSVLSTSKNAAAVRSGGGGGGAVAARPRVR